MSLGKSELKRDILYEDEKIKCTSEILGKGGFGIVYRGFFFKETDTVTVAIKRILNDDAPRREEDFLKRFSHRNILQLFHIQRDNDFQ